MTYFILVSFVKPEIFRFRKYLLPFNSFLHANGFHNFFAKKNLSLLPTGDNQFGYSIYGFELFFCATPNH
ncbi:hypothetical protein CJ263_12230 [Maribacter cobaltidurans]|uniref:Uncharacterized protein n=1 Tax=Maribacter cobaltidurans TaxID=1178778 RepID=A0A223V7E0_9FLAO|nr:hypothetical protein CJ263_12230 [Maribacter cobaltidurans]